MVVNRLVSKEELLPVFKLRDFPMAPESGTQGAMSWTQYTESVQLRLPLRGDTWAGIREEDFEVKVSEAELSVKCKRGGRESLADVNGKFKKEVNPARCWFCLERDFQDPFGPGRVLLFEVAKRFPGKAWREGGIFQEGTFRRQAFGWNEQQQKLLTEREGDFLALKPGRRSDIEDPFVASRSWLCTELEQGQTEYVLQFRVILDQRKLDECLEKVPYYRLFGLDCSERCFKLFIRGDESSPVLLGEFGGRAIPEACTFELTKHTREVEGHRIVGTMETLPCLDVTVYKAEDSRFEWEEPLKTEEEAMNQPQGSLEDFQEAQLRRQREPSPDRDDWTPDDWADEQKEKADAAFKAGEYRDAIVYYTRALRYTPLSERLLCNRSAAYMKISKFQLALDDAVKAEQVEPNWVKIFFRKGQALRGLKRWDDAVAAFQEGQVIDPENPEWEREMQRTRAVEKAYAQAKEAKARK